MEQEKEGLAVAPESADPTVFLLVVTSEGEVGRVPLEEFTSMVIAEVLAAMTQAVEDAAQAEELLIVPPPDASQMTKAVEGAAQTEVSHGG